jgi:aryl sulfotransferase
LNDTRFAWLVSWPRSGNTWLRFLIASLLRDGEPVDINEPGIVTPVANRDEFDKVAGIDSTILTTGEIDRARPALCALLASRFDGPLILRKVHDKCWKNADGARMFPPELSRGAVYIVRDPRDVAVSYSHFAHIGFDEAIRRLGDPAMTISGRFPDMPKFPQPLGSWSDHVLSWIDDSGMDVLLVRYEDLLAAPVKQLARVAEFLEISPENAPKAVAAAHFDKLRAQEDEKGFRESSGAKAPFFRMGQSGAWRRELSSAQAERIRSDHRTVMERLGYD